MLTLCTFRYILVRQAQPPGAAIAGQITSNAIADFNATADAPSPESGEDFSDAISSDVVYVSHLACYAGAEACNVDILQRL